MSRPILRPYNGGSGGDRFGLNDQRVRATATLQYYKLVCTCLSGGSFLLTTDILPPLEISVQGGTRYCSVEQQAKQNFTTRVDCYASIFFAQPADLHNESSLG